MFTKEALEEVNKSLTTVGITKKDKSGKAKTTQYAMVNERIKGFRSICPAGAITTEIISLENGVVTMKATVYDDNGKIIASGLAQEKETSSFINKTSFIENCETSAVGRALGFAGIGVDGSMASAEEVANAIMNQNNHETPQGPVEDRTGEPAYPTEEQMVNDLLAVASKSEKVNGMLTKLLETNKCRDLPELAFTKPQIIKAWWQKLCQR